MNNYEFYEMIEGLKYMADLIFGSKKKLNFILTPCGATNSNSLTFIRKLSI